MRKQSAFPTDSGNPNEGTATASAARIVDVLRESVRKVAIAFLAWIVATYGPAAVKPDRLRGWWGI